MNPLRPSFTALVVAAAAFSGMGADAPAAPPEPTDAEIHAKVVETARKTIVIVRLTLRKDLSETPEETGHGLSALVREIVDEKRTVDITGVWWEAKGTVLVNDLIFDARFIRKIEVETAGGRRYPAKVAGVYLRAPAMILAVEAPGETFPALEFPADAGDPAPGEGLLCAQIHPADERWELSVDAAPAGAQPFLSGSAAESRVRFGAPESSGRFPNMAGEAVTSSVPVVFDADGRPYGLGLDWSLPVSQGDILWKGRDLRAEPPVAAGAFGEMVKAATARIEAVACEVKLRFRQDAPEDDMGGPMMFRFRSMMRFSGHGGGEDAGEAEKTFYGIAVGPQRIFIPEDLDREAVKRIASVEVRAGGKVFGGKFLGAFRDGSGFLVGVEGNLPESVDPAKSAALARVVPCLLVDVRDRFGAKFVRAEYSRWLTQERGYRGRWHPVFLHPLPPGTWLADINGNVVGFAAREIPEDAEKKALLAQGGGGAGYHGGMMGAMFGMQGVRPWFFPEVAAAFEKYEGCVAAGVVPMSKDEARRHAWLGVETNGISKDIVKQLKARAETKDGDVGLSVSVVYEGSPAAKAGFKEGDILLSVKEEGREDPLELTLEDRDEGGGMGGGEFEGDVVDTYGALWRPQKSVLNQLFTLIGEGRNVEIRFFREGKIETRTVAIERSPVDFESAPKYKSERIGITVKDITFEVRRALQLPAEEQGVVLSKIEPGTPAEVAQLQPFEILTRVDGKPAADVKAVKEALEAAQKAGKKAVKVTVLRLGKSRIVDLGLERSAGDMPEGPEGKGGGGEAP
ncbi:MAG: PDZ domain-containing protein [Planctomycetota bacterium]